MLCWARWDGRGGEPRGEVGGGGEGQGFRLGTCCALGLGGTVW
jgi:hypothetical protein